MDVAPGEDRAMLSPYHSQPQAHSRVSSVSTLAASRQSSRATAGAGAGAEASAPARSPEASPHARLAAMKQKYGGKIRDIRRISLGPSSPSEPKPAPYKHALDRLTGLLRTNLRPHKSKPDGSKHASSSRPETPAALPSSSVSRRPVPSSSSSSSLSRHGHPPSHTRFYSLDHRLPLIRSSSALSNPRSKPASTDDLPRTASGIPRIPTPDSFRQAQTQPLMLSTPVLPILTPAHSQPDYFSFIGPSHARSADDPPPERGRGNVREYVQDLHFRSRSPKESAPRPDEFSLPVTDQTDPAIGLGRFALNPRTSRVGDQELPWKLTIPGLGGDVDVDEREARGGLTVVPGIASTTLAHEYSHAHAHHQKRDHRFPPEQGISTLSPIPEPATEESPRETAPLFSLPLQTTSLSVSPFPSTFLSATPSPPSTTSPSQSATPTPDHHYHSHSLPELHSKPLCKDAPCSTTSLPHTIPPHPRLPPPPPPPPPPSISPPSVPTIQTQAEGEEEEKEQDKPLSQPPPPRQIQVLVELQPQPQSHSHDHGNGNGNGNGHDLDHDPSRQRIPSPTETDIEKYTPFPLQPPLQPHPHDQDKSHPTDSTTTTTNLNPHSTEPPAPVTDQERSPRSERVRERKGECEDENENGNESESESEPEIIMSSTAYPGQEWRPAGYMGYE
ncbi:hypothetical protein BO70DRAFT_19822 [Aspergillus heteromorphus CBS 117.55]|uniref:Uncharacterized protein n=1 Tax=Aspergillus heteromorphus CBS 117.55 TaxID=1448321 RepID=A0A317X3R8_9EURO|nr:uncharacterized protein BO70DRAFT_19822 [Aspergillus heteromorphus CBS 117.55]PWY92811.1 hypothetical protein BO70DRAFT_19822 [Aspergillus heteromorphus CBS 117.55]